MCEAAYIAPVPFSTWTESPEHVTHFFVDDLFDIFDGLIRWTESPEHVQHHFIEPAPLTFEQITNTRVAPFNAIVYIETLWPNGRRSMGTGFLLRPDMIITAGHNMYFYEFGGWGRSNVIIPAVNGHETPFGFLWPM